MNIFDIVGASPDASGREVSKAVWGWGFDCIRQGDHDSLRKALEAYTVEDFEANPLSGTTLLCVTQWCELDDLRREVAGRIREAWIERYENDDWLRRLTDE